MSDPVVSPEDQFSCVVAQLGLELLPVFFENHPDNGTKFELRHEKTINHNVVFEQMEL